jgi:hypothetical protein
MKLKSLLQHRITEQTSTPLATLANNAEAITFNSDSELANQVFEAFKTQFVTWIKTSDAYAVEWKTTDYETALLDNLNEFNTLLNNKIAALA